MIVMNSFPTVCCSPQYVAHWLEIVHVATQRLKPDDELRSWIPDNSVLWQSDDSPVFTDSVRMTWKWWETERKVGAAFSKTAIVKNWRSSIMTFGLLAPKLKCVLGRIPFYSYIIQISKLLRVKIYVFIYIYSLSHAIVCMCLFMWLCVCACVSLIKCIPYC